MKQKMKCLHIGLGVCFWVVKLVLCTKESLSYHVHCHQERSSSPTDVQYVPELDQGQQLQGPSLVISVERMEDISALGPGAGAAILRAQRETGVQLLPGGQGPQAVQGQQEVRREESRSGLEELVQWGPQAQGQQGQGQEQEQHTASFQSLNEEWNRNRWKQSWWEASEQEGGGVWQGQEEERQGVEMQEGTGMEVGSVGEFQSVVDSMEVGAGQAEGELRDREVQTGFLSKFWGK